MLTVRSLLCAVLFVVLAPAALAHARLVKSSPGKGEVVANPPAQLELWFNELLDEGFNSIEVFAAAPAGTKRVNLVKGKPAVDPRDRTRLTLKVPSLPPGEYAVEWRVLSRDGHSAPGRFTFRITAR